MKARFVLWLRDALGLTDDYDELLARFEQVSARLHTLEQWVSNLDAALWRIDQEQQETKAGAPWPPAVEPEPSVIDFKALGARIRGRVMATKQPFPLDMEGLK